MHNLKWDKNYAKLAMRRGARRTKLTWIPFKGRFVERMGTYCAGRAGEVDDLAASPDATSVNGYTGDQDVSTAR